MPEPADDDPLWDLCATYPDLAARLRVPGSAGREGSDPAAWMTAARILRDWSAAYADLDPPAGPSSAPPGTALKLAVLESRAEQRIGLFHPCERKDSEAYRIRAAKTGGEKDGLVRLGAEDDGPPPVPPPPSLWDDPTVRLRLAWLRDLEARRADEGRQQRRAA